MIDFSVTSEQAALQSLIADLMSRHADADYLQRLDQTGAYPFELYSLWADAGLLALPFPESVGGQGGSTMDFVLASEQIGRWGYDVASAYITPIFTGLNILNNADESLRDRWLGPLMDGSARFCISITEPGSGSDAASLRTQARREGNRFVLSGEKIFCSGARVPETTICLYARTSQPDPNSRGITAFLVPNTAEGLEIRPVSTLGRHMFPTTQLFLDGVEVGADQIVGEVDRGWEVLLSGLQIERLITSAVYVGNAQTVVDEALSYAKQRIQGGKRIGDYQAIAHMLADMETKVDAARCLMYKAAWEYENSDHALATITKAKLFGSEMFAEVANLGMQVLGGYGFTMDFPMQRHFRTARAATVTAGTSQIQRNILARTMGLRP